MAEPELVIECFVTDPPRLEESFSLRLQSYITPEAWAELVRHLQAESTQCWADNTPQQTLNFCLSAALLYLGSFSPSVVGTLLPLAPLRVSLPLTFGYLAVLSGAILAYIRYNHAINSKAAAARNRVLDEVAQTVSSVVHPHGVTLTWKAAGATHHGQAAKNGFWLLELGVNSMLSPLKHFDPATVLAPPPPSTAASPEAQMASEGVSPNPDVTLLAIDPAKASPRFFPLPSTLTDFITSSAYEDLLFYLERTRSEYNNMLLGWLDTYQQQILSGLVGSALPIIWLANRFVPNIAASMFVSSAGIWLMLALFMYAAAVFYPQRERERAIAHTHYHAGVALHATRVLEGHGMRLSWRPWASPCWELEADASKRPPSPLAEFFTAQTPSEGSDEESARTSDAIAHPLLPSVQKRELSERSEDFPSL